MTKNQGKVATRRKEKIAYVAKRLIPSIIVSFLVGILIVVSLCLTSPIVPLNNCSSVSGKCVSLELIMANATKRRPSYVITLDNGERYEVSYVSSTEHFDNEGFAEAKEKGEIIIIKYNYLGIYNKNSVVEVRGENGQCFLNYNDNIESIIFFWCIVVGLYLLIAPFCLCIKIVDIYQQKYSNEAF